MAPTCSRFNRDAGCKDASKLGVVACIPTGLDVKSCLQRNRFTAVC